MTNCDNRYFCSHPANDLHLKICAGCLKSFKVSDCRACFRCNPEMNKKREEFHDMIYFCSDQCKEVERERERAIDYGNCENCDRELQDYEAKLCANHNCKIRILFDTFGCSRCMPKDFVLESERSGNAVCSKQCGDIIIEEFNKN